MSAKPPAIWEGIFDRFPKLPPSEAFSGSRWIERQEAEARQLMDDPTAPSGGGTLLSEVMSGWFAINDGPVSLLDFGGGLALDYLRLMGRGLPIGDLQFCVIETVPVCRSGRTVFRKYPQVSFRSNLPKASERVDVFHAASSLQYVSNWRAFLSRVTQLRPRMIVLGGLLAGDIPTFVTLQNYYGTKMPVWFWNKVEFLSYLDSLGYECVFDGIAEARYFGRVRHLPMSHFPKTHRLERKCNLVLRFKNPEARL